MIVETDIFCSSLPWWGSYILGHPVCCSSCEQGLPPCRTDCGPKFLLAWQRHDQRPSPCHPLPSRKIIRVEATRRALHLVAVRGRITIRQPLGAVIRCNPMDTNILETSDRKWAHRSCSSCNAKNGIVRHGRNNDPTGTAAVGCSRCFYTVDKTPTTNSAVIVLIAMLGVPKGSIM